MDKHANHTLNHSFSYIAQMQSSVFDYIKLLKQLSERENSDEEQSFIVKLCGKDSAANTLVKLCQLQQQLIKLAHELNKSQPQEAAEPAELADEDWDILSRAIEQRRALTKEIKALTPVIKKKKRKYLRSRWQRYSE